MSIPSPDIGGSTLIPLHPMEHDPWFGQCPASLMAWPLTDAATAALDEQMATFVRMQNARIEAWPDPPPRSSGLPEHPKTPHPEPSSWFGNHTKGPNVASVAEVSAAIHAVNEVIREAAALAQVAAAKYEEATEMTRRVINTTGAPLGIDQVRAAVEAIELALTRGAHAVEANEAYRSML